MSKKFIFWLVSCCLFMATQQGNAQVEIEGTLQKWHKVTLTFNGPNTAETANPNPFSDYSLSVTFTNGNNTYTVPGYYAACGNAAENGCDSGNKWRVHFSPNKVGQWDYSVSFKTGEDVAIGASGVSAGYMDNATGSFEIAASDKIGRDHRAKGRLQYVGQHYLQFADSKEWFIKGGADAPENTLSYTDFDATPNAQKDWSPHLQDYDAANAQAYTWQNGKGKGLLGALNYLSQKGMNAFSFLTFSLDGDDDTVYPHLQKENNATNWNDVHHDRFDVSKMEQWEKIFEYADQMGLYLHFKTQETENDQKMDGGAVGRERKLYYQALVANFSHHLALNWNTGEENTQTTTQEREMAAFLNEIDPYKHNIVMHTYPNQKSKYDDLIGNQSLYTGASLQSGISSIHEDVVEWVNKSRDAGKRWIVANDEQGNAQIGVDRDPNDRKKVREEVIWGTLMGGGAGFEFYYGYSTVCTDLTCQDHRSRDQKYTDAAYALQFFQNHFTPYLPDVQSEDDATEETDDFVLRSVDQKAYAIYRHDGGVTDIELPSGNWTIAWYNPRTGIMGNRSSFVGSTLIAPDGSDWVAFLIQEDADNSTPIVQITAPTNGVTFTAGENIPLEATVSNFDTDVIKVTFYSNDALLGEDTTAPYSYTMENASAGTYALMAIAEDSNGNTTTSAIITINVVAAPAVPIVTSFSLYDTNTDEVIAAYDPLSDGAVINLSQVGKNITIVANTLPSVVGSVQYTLNGSPNRVENVAPYALFGDRNGDFKSGNIGLGTYTIAATPFTEKRTRGEAGTPLEITIKVVNEEVSTPVPPTVNITTPSMGENFDEGTTVTVEATASDEDGNVQEVRLYSNGQLLFTDNSSPYRYEMTNLAAGNYELQVEAIDNEGYTAKDVVTITVLPAPQEGEAVIGFELYNANTNQSIGSLTDGDTINLSVVGSAINIIAITNPATVGSVQFILNGSQHQVENVAPYALDGDENGNFYAWEPDEGDYEIKATPFSASNKGGDTGQSKTINIVVVDESAPALLPPTNLIARVIGEDQIQLTWNEAMIGDRYLIEYAIGNSNNFDYRETIDYRVTTKTFSNIPLDTRYYFRIQTIYNGQESNWSTTVNAIISSEPSGGNCTDYEERNGIVVFEPEHLNPPAPWKIVNANDAANGQYIVWEGGNQYNNPGQGEMIVKFDIYQTGRYRFLWRMRQTNGFRSDESNDSWIDFPDARFIGKKGNDIEVFDDYIKIFGNGFDRFQWRATGDVEHIKYEVYVEFDEPGTYTMRLSGRSDQHQLDRIVLFHSSVDQSDATDLALSETRCLPATTIEARSNTTELKATVYPNPVNTTAQLAIEAPTSTSGEVQLYNIHGKLMRSLYRGELKAEMIIPFQRGQLPAGIYWLKIRTNTDEYTTSLMLAHR